MTIISTKIRDSYDPVDEESNMSRNTEENSTTEEMLEEVPFSTGYIPDPEDSRDYKISSIFKSYANKGSVDYTNEMSPVKNQGSKGCHDKDTQILTDDGWKYFCNLDGSENIATVNPNNHVIEFQNPINYIKYYYKGEMYHCKNNIADFKVTPDHRMWVRKWNNKESKLSDNFEFIKIKDIGWYSELPTNFGWIGHKNKLFELDPVVIGPLYNKERYSIKKLPSINMKKWSAFLGLYLAEGYTQKTKRGNYRVGISSSVNKPYHRDKIEEIINDIPVKWTEYKDRFICHSKVLYENLKQFGRVYDKFVPDYIKNADIETINSFLYGFILGDGHRYERGDISIYTSSEFLKDDILELGLKVGYFPSVTYKKDWKTKTSYINGRKIKATTKNYNIFLSNKPYPQGRSIDRNKYVSKVNYEGFVYCVEVPNHIIITRRNEKVLVSGNSCVGMAVAAVLEWQQQQEYLKEKESGSYYTRDEKHYNLSEQWIYHKAKEVDEFPEDTSGTTIRAAMKVVNKQGVPPEHGWEYSDSSVGKPEFWAGSIANWNKNKYYYRISNIDEMKKVLATIGPFMMGVYVFIEMFYPDNGYVAYPSNPNNCYGGHALAVIGYDDNKKVFKFKNSWGDWGDEGYGYLPYSYVKDFSIISWATIDEDIKEI